MSGHIGREGTRKRRRVDRRGQGSGGSGGRGAGFSLIELMVVVAIMALLISIIVPAAQQALESARRVTCRTQLRGIGQALVMYAGDHDGRLPIAPGSSGEFANVGAARNAEPEAGDPTPVSATLWAILRRGGLDAKMFVCPSTRHAADSAGALDADVWDFESADRLSYAIQYPYGSRTNLGQATAVPSMVPVLGDRGPHHGDGGDLSAMPTASAEAIRAWLDDAENRKRVNSANHGGAGQNVVYADGHGEWRASPLAGPREDNIYSVQSGATDVGRMHGLVPGQTGANEPRDALDAMLVF